MAVENLKQAGRVLRCIYIKTNGVQCGSPALRNSAYCFAHSRLAMRHPPLLDIPILEDANSVQVAIMEVIRGLLSGEVERKTAGLLLYGLQMASANLKYVSFEPKDRGSVIRNIDDVVRYCDVDTTDVAANVEADEACPHTASASPGEEVPAVVHGVESNARVEASLPAQDQQPQTTDACCEEAASDAAALVGQSPEHSSVNQSSTQPDSEDLDAPGRREKLEQLRAEVRARSGQEPPPSAEELHTAGIRATDKMLDALAEAHRLAKVVVETERSIGESVW